jgi:hypothetical protein
MSKILNTQYSILNTQYSILNTQYSILNTYMRIDFSKQIGINSDME